MKIAIVILNYNGEGVLETFLPEVLKHSEEHAVYIIDNNSQDQSIAFLKKNYPDLPLIELKQNKGYAGGYNEGLRQIDADIYALINSDIATSPNWIKPILEEFENSSNTGIIQPKIRSYRQPEYFEYAGASGGFLDKYGYAYCRGRIFDHLEKDKGQYDDPIDINWASGACLFIRKEIFDELGGFDSDYFAHFEEIDLCWRARNKGHEIKVVPTSVVYHLGGGTLDASSPFKTYLNYRNSLYTLLKNLPQSKLFSILFSRMVLDGVSGMHLLLQGKPKHFLQVLKAHFSFYKNLRKIYLKRESPQNQNYFQVTSIVWNYFIGKKNTYLKNR